jgi:hypothetical protein
LIGQKQLRTRGTRMSIDSYRLLDFASRQIMTAWAARAEPGVVPFTRLAKPLRECTVGLAQRVLD